MKIICVATNYRPHLDELNAQQGNAAAFVEPVEPVIFFKPDSALANDRMPFFIPDFSQRIEYETEIVLRISKLGKNIAEKFAHRYYDAVGIGLDMTARDLQQEARRQAQPWALSKGFDQSAIVSRFLPVGDFDLKHLHFHLELNGKTVQQGSSEDMIFGFDRLVSYVSRFCTLKTGDLIFCGTPSGVGPVAVGDELAGWLESEKLLDLRIR